MINNDILRRLRYAFDLSDAKMMALLSTDLLPASREQVSNWLRKEDDEQYTALKDDQFAVFLDNFIVLKRGPREGAAPETITRLNNNIIFMKLKIALNLKAEDVMELMDLAEFRMSKHELSAFFRKRDHKHYRECKDQILRHFLKGIQLKYRDGDSLADS